MAEAAASGGKAYCILQIGVGLDTAAVREAVVKVMEQKVICSYMLNFCLYSPKQFVIYI